MFYCFELFSAVLYCSSCANGRGRPARSIVDEISAHGYNRLARRPVLAHACRISSESYCQCHLFRLLLLGFRVGVSAGHANCSKKPRSGQADYDYRLSQNTFLTSEYIRLLL